MVAVETVKGPVEVDALGVTLMHEHVFVLTPDVLNNFGHEYWDEEERVADAVRKLTTLKQSGVDTIVDPTVIGLGRYIPRVARINAQVDINIIAAIVVFAGVTVLLAGLLSDVIYAMLDPRVRVT